MDKNLLFPKNSWLAGAVLLVVMCCVVYFPFLQGSFIWDDHDYLTNNPNLTDLDGLKRLWFDLRASPQYYPLVDTSFWIEYQFWGLNPVGYHVDNVILQCINALLLWRVLSYLGVKGSWLAAAIFAIHPVQIESVAWIVERKNLLSGFFYFLSLYFFLRFYNPDKPFSFNDTQNEKRSWMIYGVSLFFFVCALLSKTSTCTLPAVILLIYWWKQSSIGKKVFLMMIPFFTVSVGFALITIYLETSSVGATGLSWSFSFWDRFLIAGRVLWFYTGKLFWPDPIIFIYPRWVIDDSIWWQYVYPLAFLFLILVLWNLRKIVSRGPLTALLFFAGSLFPVLGFFNVYFMRFSFVANHFLYLAGIGIIVIFASSVDKFIGDKRYQKAFIAGILIILGGATWSHGPAYKNDFSLWNDTIRKNPDAFMAHTNLGNILYEENKIEEAIPHYKTAIRLKPDDGLAYNNLGSALQAENKAEEAISNFKMAVKLIPGFADAHHNLAKSLLAQGKLQGSIFHYKTTIRLKPDLSEAHLSLGRILYTEQKTEGAIFHFKRAIELKPDDSLGYIYLGSALYVAQKAEEAIFNFKKAIELKPDLAEAHFNLAKVLMEKKQLNKAESFYREAIRFKEGYFDAYYNLGRVLVQLGKHEEAVTQYMQALKFKPDFPEAHNHLGYVLSELKKYDQSIEYFNKAISLKADYANAYLNLANALVHKGEVSESIAYYKEAIRLNDDYTDAHYNLGVIYGQGDNFKEAMVHFERVVNIDPNYANARKNLELARSMTKK